MRVFVTGASGNIGLAVTRELLLHQHEVLALARSDSSAALLKDLGADVIRGSLEDLNILKKAVSECDSVAHLAFIVDFENYAAACETDRAVIEAMGSSLATVKGDRALVISSGTALLRKGQLVTENDPYDENDPFGALRGPSEAVALGFAKKGVRVSVMRLPSVYGEGSLGWVAPMLAYAQKQKEVAYVSEGDNRWCTTHTLDVARAYRLALEKGREGSVFHVVAEEGVRTKDVAIVLGKQMGLPVVAKAKEEASGAYGLMAGPMTLDNPSSSAQTREQLGWQPMQLTLLEFLESGDFAADTAAPLWSTQ
ncbi:putative oxidoreductase [Xylariaceae sp. FL1272]|nr:putative oxidoreductase [Xylariaceae sp. FL1272]